MKSDMPETGSGGAAGPTAGDPATDVSPVETPVQPQANGRGRDGSAALPLDDSAPATDIETLLEPQPVVTGSDDETAASPVLLVSNPAANDPTDDELLHLAAPRQVSGKEESKSRSRLHIDDRVGRLLLSAVLAVLLWYYVMSLENPAQNTNFPDLNVAVRNTGTSLKAVVTPDVVNSAVTAPQNALGSLTRSDIRPYVDLTGLSEGVHTVPVRADINSPRAGEISVQFNPPKVEVQLALQVSRIMSVTVQINGTPAFGYGLETAQVTPQQVKVSGDKEAVDRIAKVVAIVDVDGKAGTQQGSKLPVALDAAGQEVKGVTFTPPTVEVVVPVKLLLNYKAVPVRAPIVGQPAPGYRVSSITLDPTNVTLCCEPSLLESLEFLSAEPVAITGTTSPVITTTNLILPTGVSLYQGQPKQITVTVNVQVLETTFQVSVAPTVEGVEPGWNAIVSPDKIDLTLAGTFQQAQSLSPTDIRAIVNVQGRPAGTFSTKPLIVVPQGVKLNASTPETVTVTLVAPTPVPTHTPTALPTNTPAPTSAATSTLVPVPSRTAPTEGPTTQPAATGTPAQPTPTHTPSPTGAPATPTPTVIATTNLEPTATSTPATGPLLQEQGVTPPVP